MISYSSTMNSERNLPVSPGKLLRYHLVIKQVRLIYVLVLRNWPASNYRQTYRGTNYLLKKYNEVIFWYIKHTYIAFTDPYRKVIQKYMILRSTDHSLQAVQCTAQAMGLLPMSELRVLYASCCQSVGLVTATKQNTVQWMPTFNSKARVLLRYSGYRTD